MSRRVVAFKKCLLPYCARAAASKYNPEYCGAHEARAKRGKPLDTPIRPRGESERARTIEECAYIVEGYGPEGVPIAALLRRLKKVKK